MAIDHSGRLRDITAFKPWERVRVTDHISHLGHRWDPVQNEPHFHTFANDSRLFQLCFQGEVIWCQQFRIGEASQRSSSGALSVKLHERNLWHGFLLFVSSTLETWMNLEATPSAQTLHRPRARNGSIWIKGNCQLLVKAMRNNSIHKIQEVPMLWTRFVP